MSEREIPAGWVEMRLRGLILDPNSESPVVILREERESIYLPIWIGVFEANAIALALEEVKPRRPMTHDLLRSTVESLGGTLARIEIHSLQEGTFFARLVVQRHGQETLEIDARPSDAIALALRMSAPIWTAREVLQHAVASSKAAELSDDQRLREWLENAKPEELGKYSM
ncbi:MAG: bifunctional nuclease family protein [Candidatus Binatia bacterium]